MGAARFAALFRLEYMLNAIWVIVVRYHHDPGSHIGHDVTKDGLHLDGCRDGEKYRTSTSRPGVRIPVVKQGGCCRSASLFGRYRLGSASTVGCLSRWSIIAGIRTLPLSNAFDPENSIPINESATDPVSADSEFVEW